MKCLMIFLERTKKGTLSLMSVRRTLPLVVVPLQITKAMLGKLLRDGVECIIYNIGFFACIEM